MQVTGLFSYIVDYRASNVIIKSSSIHPRHNAVSDYNAIGILRVLLASPRPEAHEPSIGMVVSRKLVWGFPDLIAIGNFL